MTITAPQPIFRLGDQTALYGIAVDVLKLLDKFFVVADVTVVITPLPEGCVLRSVAYKCLILAIVGPLQRIPLSHGWFYALRRCDLQRLNHGCNGALLRF